MGKLTAARFETPEFSVNAADLLDLLSGHRLSVTSYWPTHGEVTLSVHGERVVPVPRPDAPLVSAAFTVEDLHQQLSKAVMDARTAFTPNCFELPANGRAATPSTADALSLLTDEAWLRMYARQDAREVHGTFRDADRGETPVLVIWRWVGDNLLVQVSGSIAEITQTLSAWRAPSTRVS